MKKPPETIDNARVLFWAWSGPIPFGTVKYTDGRTAAEIYGLAICQPAGSDDVYRFSCDINWETEQDAVHISVRQAQTELAKQYKNVPVKWIKFEV